MSPTTRPVQPDFWTPAFRFANSFPLVTFVFWLFLLPIVFVSQLSANIYEILVITAVEVAIVRQVFNWETTGRNAGQLALDIDVMRVLGAIGSYICIFLVVVLLGAVTVALAYFPQHAITEEPLMIFLTVLIAGVGIYVTFYVFSRLSLAPIYSAIKKPGEAWSLSLAWKRSEGKAGLVFCNMVLSEVMVIAGSFAAAFVPGVILYMYMSDAEGELANEAEFEAYTMLILTLAFVVVAYLRSVALAIQTSVAAYLAGVRPATGDAPTFQFMYSKSPRA